MENVSIPTVITTVTSTLPTRVPIVTVTNPLVVIDLADWSTSLALVVSVLSMIGSLVIIVCYLAFDDMRTTSREILAYLSLCDVIGDAMTIWGVSWSSRGHSHVSSANVQCQVQAVMLINIGIAEYLWTCALSFYLFVIIVRRSVWGSVCCPRIVHIICWGVGFVISPIAFALNKTGIDHQASNTAQWCILRGAEDPKMGGHRNYVFWSFLVGDGWSFLAIICTLVFYILIKKSLYKNVSKELVATVTLSFASHVSVLIVQSISELGHATDYNPDNKVVCTRVKGLPRSCACLVRSCSACSYFKVTQLHQ